MDAAFPNLIDSHFHLLALERTGVDVLELLETMDRRGMRGIDIGLDGEDLGTRMARFSQWSNIRFAAGIGPWGVAEGQKPITTQIEILARLLDRYNAVAIGEIGLDNHWKYGTTSLQEELMIRQIEMAEERGLPIIIHNREADEQFMRILPNLSLTRRGIFHCYQGGEALALRAIEKGFLISFAGPLTYKANKQMQELFATLPLTSILLETDSPYLSPVPLRGETNTPLSMIHIYRHAAHLRGMELASFIDAIESNYRSFLDHP